MKHIAALLAAAAFSLAVSNDIASEGIVSRWLCPQPVTAIDGDTVKQGAERYRLIGIDAPEIRTAKCDDERVLGRTAGAWLQIAIWRARHVEIAATGHREKYGRQLARLILDGRDVGADLIARGLARRYAGGQRGSWCG